MYEPTADGVDPGPIIPDLLTLQRRHRSTHIWAGQLAETVLSAKRNDSTFWEARPFDPRVEQLMEVAGFGGVIRLPYMKIDHPLITALVERWRQETHTFHLTVGEATITLQDVEVLFGLRVDGDPVIGQGLNCTQAELLDMCDALLGFRPTDTDLDGFRLKISSLERALTQPLPPYATPDMVTQHTRCRIMQLIGGFLFSDKSGNRVHLRFLKYIRNLELAGTLSWGSAALAHLYRCMCNATSYTAHTISGPLLLIQV